MNKHQIYQKSTKSYYKPNMNYLMLTILISMNKERQSRSNEVGQAAGKV